ncbi:MAG: UDP-3-O-acyl-N-acetylglucosamine deacetylase [Synergistaceae bacterium]|nr:UDP-3-O-acyl-N-acetylglucosamine deacetylase [Synergistaceae bacterium]
MRKRRTIAAPVTFEGVGIHSGEVSRLTVLPLFDRSGICFRFGRDIFPITSARSGGAVRSSSVIFPGGQTLRTVEHVLGALSGLNIDDVLIEAPDGAEFPILDGSALEYVSGFTSAGITEKDETARCRALVSPFCLDHGRANIAAIPSEALRATYVIDYPGTAIGTVIKDAVITPESFAKEIAPARTFALLSEVESLRHAGLAGGGSLENTLVFTERGAVNDAPLRIDGECAAHKILDLLGDLALAGPAPIAHYICVRGGHELHLKLAARLRRLSANQ